MDGFNLYFSAVRGTPYKWLNLRSLFSSILRPANTIIRIRYFTANVTGKRNPLAPTHQAAYLRALATMPGVSIHKGRFLVSTKWAALAAPPRAFVRPDPVTVLTVKTEEKGSDVSLATYLLRDAYRDEFDVGVVVSNDTDLVEPIRLVTSEIRKPVGLICPAQRAARSLTAVASFCRHISRTSLGAAQFPDVIPGTTIFKPESW